MENKVHNIQKFLSYLMAKEGVTSTDRMVYILMIEKPDLYKRALQAVYPEKTNTVSSKAVERLRDFVHGNTEELNESGLNIDNDQINYDELFMNLFC